MNKMDGPGKTPPPPPEGGKRSAWMTHVKKTMRAHKGLKLKQVLKLAKKTYKKGMKGGSQVLQPHPIITGGRRRRGTRRSRRGGNE